MTSREACVTSDPLFYKHKLSAASLAKNNNALSLRWTDSNWYWLVISYVAAWYYAQMVQLLLWLLMGVDHPIYWPHIHLRGILNVPTALNTAVWIIARCLLCRWHISISHEINQQPLAITCIVCHTLTDRKDWLMYTILHRPYGWALSYQWILLWHCPTHSYSNNSLNICIFTLLGQCLVLLHKHHWNIIIEEPTCTLHVPKPSCGIS